MLHLIKLEQIFVDCVSVFDEIKVVVDALLADRLLKHIKLVHLVLHNSCLSSQIHELIFMDHADLKLPSYVYEVIAQFSGVDMPLAFEVGGKSFCSISTQL